MIHPQERALQRYNKELELSDIINIAKIIHRGEHMIIGPAAKGPGRMFCYVTYNNIPYKTLYDRVDDKEDNRVRIITIYPFDADEYNELLQQKEYGGGIDYLVKKFMEIFEVEDDKT